MGQMSIYKVINNGRIRCDAITQEEFAKKFNIVDDTFFVDIKKDVINNGISYNQHGVNVPKFIVYNFPGGPYGTKDLYHIYIVGINISAKDAEVILFNLKSPISVNGQQAFNFTPKTIPADVVQQKYGPSSKKVKSYTYINGNLKEIPAMYTLDYLKQNGISRQGGGNYIIDVNVQKTINQGKNETTVFLPVILSVNGLDKGFVVQKIKELMAGANKKDTIISYNDEYCDGYIGDTTGKTIVEDKNQAYKFTEAEATVFITKNRRDDCTMYKEKI